MAKFFKKFAVQPYIFDVTIEFYKFTINMKA